MSNFNLDVVFNKCTLTVYDHSCYMPNTCSVDFVAYIVDGVSTISAKSKSITMCANSMYAYSTENDGRYVYYKVLLPYYDLFDGCGYSVNIPKGYFVAENENGEKIICLNQENSVSLQNSGENLNVKEITDYSELLSSDLISPEDIYSKEFFSICKLNECVLKLQKKYLLQHVDDCGTNKCKKGSDTDKANRDFLFIASYVLDYLISIEDYDQAEDILDKLSTCSGLLCDDNNNSNCGCNG